MRRLAQKYRNTHHGDTFLSSNERTNRYTFVVFLLLTTTLVQINEIEEQPHKKITSSKTQTQTLLSVTDDGGATTDGSSSRLAILKRNDKKIPTKSSVSFCRTRKFLRYVARTQISRQPAHPLFRSTTFICHFSYKNTARGARHSCRQGQSSRLPKTTRRIPVPS